MVSRNGQIDRSATAELPADLRTAIRTTLPVPAPGERYHVRGMTELWLAKCAEGSVHTASSYTLALRLWLEYCLGQRLDPLTARAADVDDWTAGLARSGNSPGTIEVRIAAVSAWYRYLADELSVANPCARAKKPKRARRTSKTRYLSLDQTALVLRTAVESAMGKQGRRRETAMRTAAIVWVGVTTGLRSGALLGARVGSLIDNGGQRLLRYHLKGHAEDQEAALPDQSLAVLGSYLDVRAERLGVTVATLNPAAPLFASIPVDDRDGDKPVDGENFSLSLRAIARAAGIPHADELVPHSLRHTSGTALHQLGLTGRDVQEHLQHASLTTTGTYLHPESDSRPAQVLATELAARISAIGSVPGSAAKPQARKGLDAIRATLRVLGEDPGVAALTARLLDSLRTVLDLCDRPFATATELADACREAVFAELTPQVIAEIELGDSLLSAPALGADGEAAAPTRPTGDIAG
ncbi:MAG: tyrosine-type recombinase/integrase [Mycobacteriales bacterium]